MKYSDRRRASWQQMLLDATNIYRHSFSANDALWRGEDLFKREQDASLLQSCTE